MAISYVEDIASEYYRLKGYLTSRSIKYQVPRTETGKKASAWRDIDILALNEKEVLVIKCESFAGIKKAEVMAEELLKNFEYATKFYIEKNHLFKDKKIRKILVVDYFVRKLDNMLVKEGIEVVHLENLIQDFFKILKPRIEIQRLGKEEHPMTRTLLFLLERGLIKINE